MIVFENPDLEYEVKKGISCFAVPCEVFVPVEGEAVVTTYTFCKDIAEKWVATFKCLASEEALEWARTHFNASVEERGYKRVENENEHMLEYVFTPDMHMPKIQKAVKVHKISSNAVLHELCKASGCDIEIADDGEDVIFAIVEDGKLLSYAGMNDMIYADGSVEISVETAPQARRRGFGLLCVDALVGHLLSKGITVRYKCARSNVASSALCEKYGFRLEGERISLVFERK